MRLIPTNKASTGNAEAKPAMAKFRDHRDSVREEAQRLPREMAGGRGEKSMQPQEYSDWKRARWVTQRVVKTGLEPNSRESLDAERRDGCQRHRIYSGKEWLDSSTARYWSWVWVARSGGDGPQ